MAREEFQQKRPARGRKAKWDVLPNYDAVCREPKAENLGGAKRLPAYYSFDGVKSDHENNNGQTSILLDEAYWQVQNSLREKRSGYPRTTRYVDALNLPLQKVSPYEGSVLLHIPLVPGQTKAWHSSQKPGAVRAYFDPEEPWNFDVLYHDPRKPRHHESGQHAYSLARYHPEPSEARY